MTRPEKLLFDKGNQALDAGGEVGLPLVSELLPVPKALDVVVMEMFAGYGVNLIVPSGLVPETPAEK